MARGGFARGEFELEFWGGRSRLFNGKEGRDRAGGKVIVSSYKEASWGNGGSSYDSIVEVQTNRDGFLYTIVLLMAWLCEVEYCLCCELLAVVRKICISSSALEE